MKRSLVFLLLSLVFSPWSLAKIVFEEKTETAQIQVELLKDGLGVPWGLALLSANQILFTERQGEMGILNLETGRVVNVQGVPPVMARGQGGLLDVAVSPNFATDSQVYFTYVKDNNGQGVTTLARAKIKNNRLLHWQDIFVSQSATSSGNHFGSRIAFDGKGHLFLTVGDRGERESAQDLSRHNGSVLRLNLDGSVPKDNPFVKREGALAEIWSYGHRNPQGIAYDPTTDRLWLIEHGPRGGDEINHVQPGRNYGWPVISYGKEYWGPISVGEGTEKEGMEQPRKTYIPSIAPSSLLIYQGGAFPAWRGNLLAGALRLTHINRLSVAGNGELIGEERLLDAFDERVRALIQGVDGLIYFSTDSGKIFRIRPR